MHRRRVAGDDADPLEDELVEEKDMPDESSRLRNCLRSLDELDNLMDEERMLDSLEAKSYALLSYCTPIIMCK